MGGNGGSDQMHQGQGEPGGPGAYHQGQGNLDKVLADDGDDDSDRPDWAGGDKDANPHRGDGNAGGDSKKGGDYGDIWIVLRDDTGLPILDANGNLQPCGDVECTTENLIALTVDGELPPGATPIEVEFGRLNIARSPDSVLEHSLVEALSKLDGLTWDVDVKVDEAGRLTIGDATIDSPLENLAIYEAKVTSPTPSRCPSRYVSISRLPRSRLPPTRPATCRLKRSSTSAHSSRQKETWLTWSEVTPTTGQMPTGMSP
jgi:hypothetical protein